MLHLHELQVRHVGRPMPATVHAPGSVPDDRPVPHGRTGNAARSFPCRASARCKHATINLLRVKFDLHQIRIHRALFIMPTTDRNELVLGGTRRVRHHPHPGAARWGPAATVGPQCEGDMR